MMRKILHFHFKGARNYIQGGDIFDALEAIFRDKGLNVVQLRFIKFSRNHLALMFEEPNSDVVCDGVAVDLNGLRKSFWLIETELPVLDRCDYDEGLITEMAYLSSDEITCRGVEGFSIIEQIIALTKVLNYAKAPVIDGRWVFGQLRLKKSLPATVGQYRVKQRAMLSNRFSVQDIYLDDDDFGEIRFIVGAP